MPSRIRIKRGVTIFLRGNIWWLQVSCRGQQTKRSLDTSNQLEAIRKAARAAEASNPAAALPPVQHRVGLEQALERYEKQYLKENRASSAERSFPVVQKFVEGIGPDQPVHTITRQQVVAFRDKRAETCSRHTANGDLARVRAFCRFLQDEGLLDADICMRVKRLKVSNVAKDALPPETVAGVLKAMEGHPWLRDYVTVLAETGMRPQEAMHVRGCDLDAKNRLLHVQAWGGWQQKDSEDRTLALNDKAFEILSRRKLANGDDSLPLFVGRLRKVREHRPSFRRFKQLLPDCLKHVTLYDFRHYYATQARAAGRSLEDVKDDMGHACISTTIRWYYDKKAVKRAAPPVLTTPAEEGPKPASAQA